MPLSQTWQSTGRLVAVQVKKANRQILRALLSLASAALLLRLGGMVNQVVVSASFGAGATMDAYFVAAAFPLLLVQLISSAIEAAVIPVYMQLRVHTSKEATARLVSTLLNLLALGALALVGTLFALRQPVVLFFAPGLDPSSLNEAIALTPLLYLVIPLSLLIGLLDAVLNAEGQFGWPAYAGLLVPLTTAVLTLIGGKTWGIQVLCVGALLGTAGQLGVVCIRARRAGLRYWLVLEVRNPDLARILRAAWPVLLGALIIQGSPLVDQIFASALAAGSISALNYALKLVSIFSGVLFVSLGRAALPALSRQAALGDRTYRAFKQTLGLYLWGLGLCTLICSLVLVLLARPLVTVLFQRGAFSSAEAQSTAIVLLGFGVGLLPMSLSFLLTRACNALGETRIPMGIAFVSMGANAACDALFAHYWQALGIALATSAVYALTSALLFYALRRKIGSLALLSIPVDMLKRWKGQRRQTTRYGHPGWRVWLHTHLFQNRVARVLFAACLTLLTLIVGVIATVRDALMTLRVTVGLLLILCLLRYPYVLLLLWASVNVGIGSSLGLLNGNNLDTLLSIPLLLCLFVLPWRELAGRVPGLGWMVCYLVWVLVGIGLSPLDTRAFLIFWLSMLAAVATGVLAVALVTTRKRLLGLIDVLLATAFLVALYGLYGFITHQNGELDPQTLLFRVYSLFTQATTFALYLSLVIPLALYRCLYLRGAQRLLALLVTCVLLGALLLTFTRTAYLSALCEIFIMACCLPSHKVRAWLACGLAVLCAVALVLGANGQLPFLARFFNSDISTLNGRVYLWQALLSRFQVTQWLGNGLQSSDQLLNYLQVGNNGVGVIGTAPHNLFLGTLYDHGVIGLGLLCGFFLTQGARLLRGVCKSSGEQRMLYAVALAALTSMLLQSMGSRDLWIQAAGVPFWLVIALPYTRYWPLPVTEKCVYEQGGPANDERESRLLPDSPQTVEVPYAVETVPTVPLGAL